MEDSSPWGLDFNTPSLDWDTVWEICVPGEDRKLGLDDLDPDDDEQQGADDKDDQFQQRL